MTMTEQPSKRELYPRVADFYNGKSIFITGAAGFVGMVLLEILLRTCPGIRSIYILIREKKGVKPEQRKEKLFQKVIFNQLKADHPNALDKVQLVAGDIAKPGLGLSEEDTDRIIEDVSIVFHCAADLNFVKPVKFSIGVNGIGTQSVVELCKKLKELEALVYTSTICSNCNRSDRNELIEEEIYRLPFKSEKFLKAANEGTDESVEALVNQCQPTWPNGYTFSKCLGENIVLENASHIPSAIIRPSLVSCTIKAPHPGFCPKGSILQLLTEGCGKGFIKVILVDEDNLMDHVPVDVVANCHIVSAWKVATQRCKVPFVVNCSTYGILNETWSDMRRQLLKIGVEHPLPNTFRVPTEVLMTKELLIYRLTVFYEHFVPAFVIDLFLKLSGKKLRLTPIYELFDKAMMAATFFTLSHGQYNTTNFQIMEKDLDSADKEIFHTDVSQMSFDLIREILPKGNDTFDWKKDKYSKEVRMKKAAERAMFTSFIKYAFLIVMFTMVYFISSKVYQLVF